MKNDQINKIVNLISKDELLEAIDEIKEIIQESSTLKEEIIILESRLRKLMKEDFKGIIDNYKKCRVE